MFDDFDISPYEWELYEKEMEEMRNFYYDSWIDSMEAEH